MEGRAFVRRWPRFSLAAIFFAMLLLGVLLAGYQVGFRLGYSAGDVRRQRDTRFDDLYTDVYGVADLLMFKPDGSLRTAIDGPFRKSEFGPLIDLITSTVEPDCWNGSGRGQGACDVFPENQSLVVTQSWPVHDKVKSLLHQLRVLSWKRVIHNADRQVAAYVARWLH